METGSGVTHCSQVECIAALRAEIAKTKRLLGKSDRPAEPERGGGERVPETVSAHRAAR